MFLTNYEHATIRNDCNILVYQLSHVWFIDQFSKVTNCRQKKILARLEEYCVMY